VHPDERAISLTLFPPPGFEKGSRNAPTSDSASNLGISPTQEGGDPPECAYTEVVTSWDEGHGKIERAPVGTSSSREDPCRRIGTPDRKGDSESGGDLCRPEVERRSLPGRAAP
jgi:hypothetical protein